MRYVYYNPNPKYNRVGDCVVRALTIALNKDWDEVYTELFVNGYSMKDMPSANHVWGVVLRKNGYKQYAMPDDCPYCYTVEKFAVDHPQGVYILALDSHVVAVKDGIIYDTWDSGNEIPIYYFKKGD